MKSSERLAIVTGTTSGLGAALKTVLLERGWIVWGIARRGADQTPDGYRHIALDLGRAEDLERLASKELTPGALAPFKKIALINNAGQLGPVMPISGLPLAGLSQAFHVNAIAPIWLMRTLMQGAEGKTLTIVNISSGAALKPYPGWGAYCSTKAALRMASLVASEEADQVQGAPRPAKFSIIVYEPNVIDTPMQGEVRSSPVEHFPGRERFVGLHERGELIPPDRPARHIADLIQRDDLPRLSEERYV